MAISENSKLNKRLMMFLLVIFVVFLAIWINLFRIQIISASYWKAVGDKQYSKGGELVGERGKIISSNGEEMAYNIIEYEIDIDPTYITNVKKLASIFSEVLGLDENQIIVNINREKKEKKRYLKIADKVSLEKKNLIESKLEKEKKLMAGVFYNKTPVRFYPRKGSIEPIIGFMDYEGKGVFGIEKSFEKYLKGERGYEKKYVSTYIVFDMPVDKNKEIIRPDDGKNVFLTIDSVMQYMLDDELSKAVTQNLADWAVGIIIEPDTGKILAMSSLPVENELRNMKNEAISNAYEPGSVFKPVILSMALSERIIKENEMFFSTGQYQVHDRIIKDHDGSSTGYLSLTDIITKSSNVGMAQIGLRFDKERYYKYLRDFGMGEQTGIEMPGEIKGIVKSVKKWDGITPATTAFGQGIAATPIQIAMASAAVVNGGYLNRPLIVDRIENTEGEIIKKYEPFIKRKVISEVISEKIKQMMFETVEVGTGKAAKIDGFTIGGKTGTSQKVLNGVYAKGHYDASFVGFFPVEKPKYLCLIIVDDPKNGDYYGGSVAAPVFQKVMERIIKYKNITPENMSRKTVFIDDKKLTVDENENEKTEKIFIMPDFKGKPMREVLKTFAAMPDIEIGITGRGVLTSQMPLPGTNLENIRHVHFFFEEPKEENKKTENLNSEEIVTTNKALLIKQKITD